MTYVTSLNGIIIGEGPWDYGPDVYGIVQNPLPIGAINGEQETVTTADGRMLLSTDWYNLRRASYPSIRDQLDALWKGGEDAVKMAQMIRAVKDAYPKSDLFTPSV